MCFLLRIRIVLQTFLKCFRNISITIMYFGYWIVELELCKKIQLGFYRVLVYESNFQYLKILNDMQI